MERNTLDSIFKLAHAVKQHFHHMLETEQLGIAPMHMRALKIIEKKRDCTANDIAQFTKRDKAQITRLLAGLIEQGIIEKQPNPKDKRSQLLVITEQGQKIQAQLARQGQNAYLKMTEGLSEAEISQFETIAEKMARNIGRL